jgi:hypothetical protein
MAGGNASSATQAADNQQQNSGQNLNFPFTPYTGQNISSTTTQVGPRRHVGQADQTWGEWGPETTSGGSHMGLFYQNWNDNPAWRTQLIAGYIASGGDPKKANDSWTMQSVWESLGKASSASVETGHPMTPMQILAFMAGKAGSNAAAQARASAQSLVKDVTKTTYQIEDPATALALTQNVLTAALGRQATPDEVNRYKAAIASYDQAHPTVEHAHSDAQGNVTSHVSGGATQQGESAIIANTVNNSAEGQAYQTNSMFDQAMKILSGL